jgi:hypothetical protein
MMMKIKNFQRTKKSKISGVLKTQSVFKHAKNPRFLSMMKKAQSLSITTVVIAILAVLVMAVLFFVFTGRMGLFTKEIQTCPSGPCVLEEDCKEAGGFELPGDYLDPVENKKCSEIPGDYVCCNLRPEEETF